MIWCPSLYILCPLDIRWKNKFWGKSMEIVPMGVTHLELPGWFNFIMNYSAYHSLPLFQHPVSSMSQHLSVISFTHSLILSFGDRYEWSKVTSCIHNILSGQRWIEHYGEMSIKHSTTMGGVSHCKVTFLKVGPSRHAKFFHPTYVCVSVFVLPTSSSCWTTSTKYSFYEWLVYYLFFYCDLFYARLIFSRDLEVWMLMR